MLNWEHKIHNTKQRIKQIDRAFSKNRRDRSNCYFYPRELMTWCICVKRRWITYHIIWWTILNIQGVYFSIPWAIPWWSKLLIAVSRLFIFCCFNSLHSCSNRSLFRNTPIFIDLSNFFSKTIWKTLAWICFNYLAFASFPWSSQHLSLVWQSLVRVEDANWIIDL